MAAKKGGLGRGLDSLFGENSTDNNSAVLLNINDIEPNRNQPRKDFDQEALTGLADSITRHGLIQPITVRPNMNGTYKIVAGERRWRACRLAGISEIPAIIKNDDDQTLMEIALVENLQREDLNPVEEALGYRALIEEYGLTQEEVAGRMGKSRSAVTNVLLLLNLTEEELRALKDGEITAGHARALLSCEEGELRNEMLRAAKDGASVRELEKMAARKHFSPKSDKKTKKPTFYSEVELSLKEALRRRVKITSAGQGKGTVTVEFFSDEELADIAGKLAGENR